MVRDIVYFAERPGAHYEALYLVPFLERTGGLFITDDSSVLKEVKHMLGGRSDIDVRLGTKADVVDMEKDVVVYSNFYPKGRKGRHVLFMHGVADKRGIARPYTFKDQNSLLYKGAMMLPMNSILNPLSPHSRPPFKWLRTLIKDRFDLILIPGKALYDLFKRAGVLRKGKYAIIGFPRFDSVLRGEVKRERVLRDLGLDPEKKTILYAPTWHGKHDFNMNSMNVMAKAIVRSVGRDLNLIVRPHPRTVTMGECPQIMKYLKDMDTNSDNVRLVDDPFYDTINLMTSADLMISDYSSVGIEYLVFDRPIIYVDHLGDLYADPELAEIYVRDAGYIVRSPKDIGHTIHHALSNPHEKSELRKRYASYFFGPLDGRAGERGAAAIEGLLEK